MELVYVTSKLKIIFESFEGGVQNEKKKILTVEDEAIVAKDISVCLGKIAYEVLDIFLRAEKALDFLENNKPDLVLMDIMLAGNLSGIEASAQIKEKHD